MDNKKFSEPRKWLERNGEGLDWRFQGPNIKNPFDSSVTDDKLEEYAADKSLLLEACRLNAYMDDTEILKIGDLTNLKFETEHPNLVDLEINDLRDYLNDSGTWDFVNKEFESLLKACIDELAVRKGDSGGSMY